MPADSESTRLNPGERIGAYRIERELGSGGMADVYYAVHVGLERPAAIKVLRASLASDETHLQRFVQEARAAASLVHPNIVQVYDVGQDGGYQYIAQEYVAGSNLRQYMASDLGSQTTRLATSLLDRNKSSRSSSSSESAAPIAEGRQLGLGETLSILLQILAALNKSAASGIVHRDIKPENIMLTAEGEVKVADFGLARIMLGDDPQLTRAGTTLGTPMYMSPEQIQEGTVDIRSDLYSLGVTLFHMLSGRPPFLGETPLALAMKHVQATVPDLSNLRSDLPNSLLELVARLLAKSPDNRFESPSEVLAYLKKQRTGDLADAWPDQAIPLPGVGSRTGTGPMQATLTLQSKLRNGGGLRRKLAATLMATLFLIGSFAVGAATTFERPFRLFEDDPTDIYKGMPKKETVEAQYQAALLSTDLDPIAKWEAVSYYFPKDASASNRYYSGQASIKLAAALQERGDYTEAEEVLNRTIRDPQMGNIYKALAHLQIAQGAEEVSDEAKLKLQVDQAIALASDEQFPVGDHQNLNEVVRLMSFKISKRWFASPVNELGPTPSQTAPISTNAADAPGSPSVLKPMPNIPD